MEIEAQNAIYLGEETGGRGRQFRARFLVPGLVKYDYGVCLLTKENADKFIQGFTGCPVVINHQNVTDDNVKDVAVGDIFSVWFDEKDGYYWCNGIIRDKEAIKLINEGYSVSCQYLITEYSDNTKGALHNGNPYDKVIENGKPEHLAIVNNPRYEGAIIAVNAIMAENADRWITIHPNGEENKGRHLLLKDGESVEDAMHRNGWYEKRQAKEGKKEDTTTTDNKIKSKLETAIKEKQARAKNPKFYDGFNIVVKDGIVKVEKDGILSSKGFQYNPEAKTGNTGADWNADALGNLITRWNNENKDTKQSDKEEKGEEIKETYKKGSGAKITEKRFENLFVDSALENNQYRITKVLSDKEHVVFDKKRGQIIFYKQGDLSDSKNYSAPKGTTGMLEEFRTSDYDELVDYLFDKGESYRFELNKASNSFVSQFKDTLYTVLAEGIYNRLGE